MGEDYFTKQKSSDFWISQETEVKLELIASNIQEHERDNSDIARKFFNVHHVSHFVFTKLQFNKLRCEAFPTYPRSYDMVHASGLLSLKHSCSTLDIFLEVDRILRPEVRITSKQLFTKFLKKIQK